MIYYLWHPNLGFFDLIFNMMVYFTGKSSYNILINMLQGGILG